MLHHNRREQLLKDLEQARIWLHAQTTYQNTETGRPVPSATVIQFPKADS